MTGQRNGALQAAQACSDATEALGALATQRAAEAAPARAAAAGQAAALNARADYTLATAPAAPGDSCASLQTLGSDWLKGGQAMMRTLMLLGTLALAGCGSVPRVEIQEVKVPVPVECREPVPDRPAMPTEALADDADPFELLRAALAEIDRREGYEVRLLAALLTCTVPLTPR